MSGLDVRNGNDPDVVPLTPQQRRTARIIASELRRTPGATARVQKAAYAAPLVEANLGNPNYGDADSLGAFQERTSIYGRSHALNVRASARRFITDAVRLNSQGFKGSAGALAQAVQRSAFPDRYDKRGAEADALVRQFVGGKAPAAGRGGQAGAQILQGGGDPGTVPQGSEGILSLVEQLTAKPQQPQSAGLAVPAVSAAPAMPQGARLVQGGGGPAPKPDIAALLEAVRTVGGDVPGGASGGQGTVLPGAAGAGQGNGQAGGGRAARGVVAFDGKPVRSDFARQLAWARAHGWKGEVTSGFRTKPQQLAAAKRFGLQHYGANGPLGSNHVVGHQGAVDVSDPDALDKILRRYPGKRTLHRGMADDPVHFSPTGH